MSGTASVSNTFAAQTGDIPVSEIDTNFTNLVTYLNDPTNRGNYAADTGTTNSIAIAFSPAVAGYTAGLQISFKAAHTNTGAATLNANTLGAKSLVNPDQSALQSGQIIAGGVYQAAYDGTVFICTTAFAIPATSAQVQTGTSAITFVSPSTAGSHKSAAKLWGVFVGTNTGTITLLGSYGVTNVVRAGTGSYTINFSTPFSSTAYAAVGFASTGATQERDGTRTSSSVMFVTFTPSGQIDSTIVQFIAFGLQ